MRAFKRCFASTTIKIRGTQDDRVSDHAVVWTINEKGADGKITEFLNNGKMVVDTTVTAAMLDDNKTTIKKYNWPTTRKWDYVAPLLANGDKDGCYQDIVYLPPRRHVLAFMRKPY